MGIDTTVFSANNTIEEILKLQQNLSVEHATLKTAKMGVIILGMSHKYIRINYGTKD